MRKNRNKQMWKFPGTTHIAFVSYGLGMLKKYRMGSQMSKHCDTIWNDQADLKRNHVELLEAEK